MAETDQGKELILAPNEQACVLDKTNGKVLQYVGPKQDALGNSMQPVLFNPQTKSFDRCDLGRAIQKMTIAPEGWYVVLKNPAKDGRHPPAGQRSEMPDLETGRKVNIPGPVAFATWPAQMVKVLPGHTLRSNQYVLVRVYDQVQARENWKDATVETVAGGEAAPLGNVDAGKLTMGQLIVIRGTHVSFFIPPTGLEVVADENGKLVREAVTLERLEYCMLLDEQGGKRFVQGPAVVFPRPTEVFKTRKVERDGKEEITRKFRAIELTPTSGIYIKVIADYSDTAGENEEGISYKMGDELFITGKDTQLYFPREEHAIIRYDDAEVHYATAIPEGEGRYVLDRLTGKVRTVMGPTMLLPDPRTEVILRRVLDARTCQLLYPGNVEALQHNMAMAGLDEEKTSGAIIAAAGVPGLTASSALYGAMGASASLDAAAYISNNAQARGIGGPAAGGFTGDRLHRKATYTPPRTLTLNTKYEGAVATSVWSGYALMLVSKSGERRVIEGPQPVLLSYDEEPQRLALSTGKPKNTDKLLQTAFLQTHGNIVSDVVEVETSDYCRVAVKLSYRVNFEGQDKAMWFSIENYVKFLCDHMRSKLRTEVRGFGIEEFYASAEDIVRGVVLGESDDEGNRPGYTFQENGMRVYDLDVLGVAMQSTEIEKLLIDSQREVMRHALTIASQERALIFTQRTEVLAREKAKAESETLANRCALDKQNTALQLDTDLTKLSAAAKKAEELAVVQLAEDTVKTELHKRSLARQLDEGKTAAEVDDAAATVRLRELAAEVDAVVRRGEAIKPDLIAALQSFGDQVTVTRIAEAMAPMSIIGGGKSVAEIMAGILAGTPFAKALTNGTTKVNGDTVKRAQQ